MEFNPLFKGRLIRLAAYRAEDQAVFARWTEDDAYMRMMDDDPVRPLPPTPPDPVQPDSFSFQLRTLEGDQLIGFVALFNLKWSNQSVEMAIGIGDPDFRGKGYGNDALRVTLNYAFSELNLYRVGLSVISYNAPAIRAYERVGFVREGAQRGAVQRQGQRYDLIFYGILRDEWLESNQV